MLFNFFSELLNDVNYSDNKLTFHNISLCFGPVLFKVPQSDGLRLKRSEYLLTILYEGWYNNNKNKMKEIEIYSSPEQIISNLYKLTRSTLPISDTDKNKIYRQVVSHYITFRNKELLSNCFKNWKLYHYKGKLLYLEKLTKKQHEQIESFVEIVESNEMEKRELNEILYNERQRNYELQYIQSFQYSINEDK